MTVYAIITPQVELVHAWRDVARYNLLCPYCLWDNNIQAMKNLLTYTADFVTGITCEFCGKEFKPEKKVRIDAI